LKERQGKREHRGVMKGTVQKGTPNTYEASGVKRADGCTTGAEWPSE
jgi:hypothetical protein